MFEYREKTDVLSITIKSNIVYGIEFLKLVSEMMERIENSQCKEVHFILDNNRIVIDHISAGFLFNVMYYLNNKQDKQLYLNSMLGSVFKKKKVFRRNEKLEKIDAIKTINGEKERNYLINGETEVRETVEGIVEFIVDNNITNGIIKEILITTIGEVFSNAFTHSNEESVSLIYNIDLEDKFFLVISITDFGKTIVKNVGEYIKKNGIGNMDSADCLKWAMEKGNTTREKSGGFGLPTLVDYMKKVDGELTIISDDAYYVLNNGQEQISILEYSFQGTSVLLKIPILDTSKMIQYDKEKEEIISINLGKL